MLKRLAICALVLGPSLHAAKKPHAWMTGVLLEQEQKREATGFHTDDRGPESVYTSESRNVYNGAMIGNVSQSGSGSGSTIYRICERYVIEVGATVFEAQEQPRWNRLRPARLTLNAPVKFYLEGDRLHLLDADGREHEAVVVKRTMKPAQSAE